MKGRVQERKTLPTAVPSQAWHPAAIYGWSGAGLALGIPLCLGQQGAVAAAAGFRRVCLHHCIFGGALCCGCWNGDRGMVLPFEGGETFWLDGLCPNKCFY